MSARPTDRQLYTKVKVRETSLRAIAGRINWWQAAEILGISDRQMRRRRARYLQQGYDGLFDRRLGRASPKRVPVATVEAVLRLYQERYFDLNVRHFHEKLQEEHDIQLSYTWVKKALQGAGLCASEPSVVRIASGERAVPCRACCCTSIAASIAGF